MPPWSPKEQFEALGSLTLRDRDRERRTLTAYFRHIHEDLGTSSWCHPELEPFLREEYKRLVLPREIRPVRDLGEHQKRFSVLSVEMDRSQGTVTLRPPGPARMRRRTSWIISRFSTGNPWATFFLRWTSASPGRPFLPGAYETSLRFLYSGLHDQRELLTSDASFPIGSKTTIRTQSFAFARVARCEVPESGVDFAGIIENEERDVLAQRAVVIQVWLNLAEPWVSAAVEILRAKGFFFGGLLPRWFDTDGLLMQKIIGEPCWEEMQIYFDRAKSLVEMVRADWKETPGK